jgi:hypothetical protein
MKNGQSLENVVLSILVKRSKSYLTYNNRNGYHNICMPILSIHRSINAHHQLSNELYWSSSQPKPI